RRGPRGAHQGLGDRFHGHPGAGGCGVGPGGGSAADLLLAGHSGSDRRPADQPARVRDVGLGHHGTGLHPGRAGDRLLCRAAGQLLHHQPGLRDLSGGALGTPAGPSSPTFTREYRVTVTRRQKPATAPSSPGLPSGPESEVHAGVGQRLASIRQRYTGGRRLLVEALIRAGRPLTVTEILDVRPALPPSTAYRNLAMLEQATVVCRVQLSGEFSRYELSEELTRHHHHLVFVDCGSVVDVP